MIRCAVFDFDGTLVRSNAIKRQAYFDAVAHLADGRRAAERVLAGGPSGDRYAVFARVARHVLRDDGERADQLGRELAARYTALCRERIAGCEEVPGATAALHELSDRGTRLYLVSATPEIDLLPIVRDRGLTELFCEVLGGPTTKAVHLNTIARRQGLKPREMIVVGDGEDDRAAAVEVGCRFIPVADGPEPALADAPGALANLYGLPGMIDRFPCRSVPEAIAEDRQS